MTFPPPALLFPSRRFVVQWLMGSAGVCILMFATDGANWIFVGATVMAAFWAADCLGRLRQWLGGALVPGYAATAWLVVLAIIASVVVLGALLSHMAGNPMPTFALAMCIGLCTVLGVVYAERWATGRAAIIAIFVAAVVPVFLTARGHIDVGVHSRLPGLGRAVPDGVMHWAALVGAGAATFALKRRLDRPTQQSRGMRTMPWRQYRSFLVAPKHILVGWYSRTSLAEWLIPGMTMLVVVPHYLLVLGEERAFHGWEGPIHVGVCWWLYVGSLTPLMLLKGAGTWLGTAWRLGQGASRPALGRAFATRVVWATACSFGIALNLVVVHAYLGGVSVPPVARHLLFFEEVLLVYAVGLLAATWALSTHPSRTTTQPDFAGPWAAASAVDATVFLMAPETDAVGILVLACVLFASGVLLTFSGGRAIARVDFVVRMDA